MAAISPVRTAERRSSRWPIAARLDGGLFDAPAAARRRSPATSRIPGNVGAIVRVAEAAGATGLVAAGTAPTRSAGRRCAARWAARSGCRSRSRSRCRRRGRGRRARHGCRIVATVPRDGDAAVRRRPARADRARCSAAKGRASPKRSSTPADERLTIPMQPPVESLNAAVAAALILYEARAAANRRAWREHVRQFDDLVS